ncbi:Transcription regulator [Hirschfeldia incana]|nr:Transcription regulator [Hirschfeldia incana]
MVSKEYKRDSSLREKFQLLRSITNSHAVTVDTLEKGFMIKIMSGKNEPGMLVCVLEAFEDLGLEVVEARVSCTDSFSLHAIGISNNDDAECMDAEAVKQAVSVAVRTWSDSHDPRGGRISDSTGKGT